MKNLKVQVPSFDLAKIGEFCRTKLTAATAETISWVAVIIIHAATIPTMLAIMSGLTEKMPPIDLVLFTWAGLALLFVKATILKDMLNIVTIGFGFVIHAVILSLILFK
jgi:hypothetical protein